MIKVKFLKSPTGKPFNMAYSTGQIGEVTNEMYEILKDAGMIEDVAEVKTSKKKAKTAASKKNIEKR